MTPGMGMEAQARRLCQYVRNTAQVPLRVDDFDDDWSPAGETYRAELLESGLIEVRQPGDDEPGGLYLTEAGKALTAEPGTPEALAIDRGQA